MSKSKYEQIYDGDWFDLPTKKMDLKCCDCGLVHKFWSRLKNGKIQIRMDRHGPATGWRSRSRSEESMTDRRTIPAVIQTYPGQPIYLRQGSDEPQPISDSQALFLAHQLIQAVLGNDQAKVRANGH